MTFCIPDLHINMHTTSTWPLPWIDFTLRMIKRSKKTHTRAHTHTFVHSLTAAERVKSTYTQNDPLHERDEKSKKIKG